MDLLLIIIVPFCSSAAEDTLVAVAATGEAIFSVRDEIGRIGQIDPSATSRPFTLHSVTKEQNAAPLTGGVNVMLRKLSIAAVIASVLFIPASALADPVNKNVHVNKNANRSVHVNKNVNVNGNVNRNAHVNNNANVNKTRT